MTMGPSETPKTKKWISEEVKKQVGPINRSVEEVKAQNREQSSVLALQVTKINEISGRLRGLWGNGTGPPGYLEIARKQDKETFDRIFATIDELRSSVLREEGKDELRKEIEINRREIESLADSRKTHRWTRYHYALSAAAILAGSWFWSLVHPLAKALIDQLVKAVQ